MFFRLKSEIMWFLKEEEIEVYHGNEKLMSVIQTDDNIRVFEFLRFLSKAPNLVEIESYKELEEGEKRDILSFLEGKNYGQYKNIIKVEKVMIITEGDFFKLLGEPRGKQNCIISSKVGVKP